MIKLFKKPSKEETTALIEQIHSEFKSAGERTLAAAQAVLKIKEDESKLSLLGKSARLERIGFLKAQTVKEGSSLSSELKMAEDTASKIMNINVRFPNNKFISEEDVVHICRKYNLIQGEISDFKGHVPDVNLNEIEQFASRTITQGRRISHVEFRYSSARENYQKEFEKLKDKIFTNLPSYGDPNSRIAELVCGKDSYEVNITSQPASTLSICAPMKDFDLKDKKINWLKRTIVSAKKLSFSTMPDPVVLHLVEEKGLRGYVIVTAWGDEANDPLIKNERLN